jgi:hypothetical protein
MGMLQGTCSSSKDETCRPQRNLLILTKREPTVRVWYGGGCHLCTTIPGANTFCDSGDFSIDLTMGTLNAFFPDQESFNRTAPKWAIDHWQQIHDALKDWCDSNSIPLVVEQNGRLYTD